MVEVEEAVLRWQRDHLGHLTDEAWRDPRVTLVHADLLDWLPSCGTAFDAVGVDVDNGPGWTVTARNAALYADAGLAALERVVAPGGALAVWSAHADDGFRARLAARFAKIAVLDVPVARGEPDRVYVAGGYSGHGNVLGLAGTLDRDLIFGPSQAFRVFHRDTAHDTVYFISFRQQMFGQITAVLSGYSCNESALFAHWLFLEK